MAAEHQHHTLAMPDPDPTNVVIPVSTTMRISSTSLSLDGKPPMVITTTHQCVSSEPIIALMKLDAQRGMGIGIHDPRRKNRRMGPMPDVSQCYDDYSEFEEFDDCRLVRLKPGETCATTLTLRIVPRTTADGLQTSFPVAKEDACHSWFRRAIDKGYLVKGNIYEVKAMRRSWRWMLESEMEKLGGELSDERCWEILKKKKTTEWDVDCRELITAV